MDLKEALEQVPDHRSRQGRRHALPAVLTFICTGVLCGADSIRGLARWGERQDATLMRAMGFPRGKAPSLGTLLRTIRDLNVDAFEQALYRWANSLLRSHGKAELQGIAIDGKRLRGSRQDDLPGVHVLATLAHDLGLTLKQQHVPATTNELKVGLELLQSMDLRRAVITGDAIFMNRELCSLVLKQNGHYLVVLKGNQPDLLEAVEDWFEPFPPSGQQADAASSDA